MYWIGKWEELTDLSSLFIFHFAILGVQSQRARWGHWQRPENPPAVMGHSRSGEVWDLQLCAPYWRKGEKQLCSSHSILSQIRPGDLLVCTWIRNAAKLAGNLSVSDDNGGFISYEVKGKINPFQNGPFCLWSFFFFLPFFRLVYFSPFTFAVYLATKKSVALHTLFPPACWHLVENIVEINLYDQRLPDKNVTWNFISSCFSFSYSPVTSHSFLERFFFKLFIMENLCI